MKAARGVVNARFQVLHLKHMEYILAAKMRCEKLYIGITSPDNLHLGDTVNDPARGTQAANPLTYFERFEMIRGAMAEFGVGEDEYDILPFPINTPECLLQYMPPDATYYLGICGEWDEEKLKVLRSLGLKTEILWRRTREEVGITGTQVRQLIATDQEWKELVPKSVYQYIKENHLDERIKKFN